MKLLIAKSGVGKTTLFSRLGYHSQNDALQIRCLLGDQALKSTIDMNQVDFRFETADIIDYINHIFLYHKGTFHLLTENNTFLDESRTSSVDKSKKQSNNFFITVKFDNALEKDGVDYQNFQVIWTKDKKFIIGFRVLNESSKEYEYGFFDSVYKTDSPIRSFDGVPYIRIGEGCPSITTLYGKNRAEDGLKIISKFSVCFIDSITSDLYRVGDGSALKGGLPSSIVSLLAQYDESDAVWLYTPTFDGEKDALASFNQRGYTSGDLYVSLNFDIKKVNDFDTLVSSWKSHFADSSVRNEVVMTVRRSNYDRSKLYEISPNPRPIEGGKYVKLQDLYEKLETFGVSAVNSSSVVSKLEIWRF